MSAPLSFTGYVRAIKDNDITIDGCAPSTWASLPREYMAKGTRKHIGKGGTSCTVRVTAKTVLEKDGECELGDLNGCYVRVIASARTYSFFAEGERVTGWTLVAKSIKKTSIPTHAHTLAH
jgi:hypothetical protein